MWMWMERNGVVQETIPAGWSANAKYRRPEVEFIKKYLAGYVYGKSTFIRLWLKKKNFLWHCRIEARDCYLRINSVRTSFKRSIMLALCNNNLKLFNFYSDLTFLCLCSGKYCLLASKQKTLAGDAVYLQQYTSVFVLCLNLLTT